MFLIYKQLVQATGLRVFFNYFRRLSLYCLNVALLLSLLVFWGRAVRNVDENTPNNHYQKDVDYAIETFNYLHNQQLGKIAPKSLDDGPLEVERHSCWSKIIKPDNKTIKRSQIIWQLESNEKTEIYLYRAYFDDRKSYLYPNAHASIQILTMIRRALTVKVYCQLWSSRASNPIVVSGFGREIWQRGWDPRNRFYVPVLITCPIEKNNDQYSHVSITVQPCSPPSNLLAIHGYSQREQSKNDNKTKVVVCVKGMDFLTDLSLRLVEWLELQLMLGADKIVIYTYTVHPRIKKVLDYYQQRNLLENIPLTLPGNSPILPYQRSEYIWRNRQQKRRNEIIPYNDCLYRHLYTHRYALIIDTDEVVVPMNHGQWPEMLNDLEKSTLIANKWTAFSVINAFKFDNLTNITDQNIPKYMHMLQHKMRSKRLSEPGEYGKSFMFLKNLVTVFNHYPLHKLEPALLKTRFVNKDVALKLHYKAKCPIESRDICPELYTVTMEDHSLDRYAKKLIKKMNNVIKRIKLT